MEFHLISPFRCNKASPDTRFGSKWEREAEGPKQFLVAKEACAKHLIENHAFK